MALRNNSIRNYFRPSLQQPEAPVGVVHGKRDPLRADSILAEVVDGDTEEETLPVLGPLDKAPCETDLEHSDPLEDAKAHESAAIQSSRERVINGSDEEDSNSDSSVEDIYVALQHRSRSLYTTSVGNGVKSPGKPHARNKRTRTLVQPSPPKPKYKFDMKTLIEQAESHKATEASALSINALLDAADIDSQDSGHEAVRDSILQSVIAEKEKDGVDAGKFLLAVKRTETTHFEKGWFFFTSFEDSSPKLRPLPACTESGGWKAMLVDPQLRDQVLLSGFAKDMVTLEGILDNDLCVWILEEISLEHRSDLREAYCKVLEIVEEQMGLFMSPEVLKRLFENLGATNAACNINEELRLVSKNKSPYEDRDWAALAAVITFIGRISKFLSTETASYAMCVLFRLCVDSLVIEDANLLVAVQKAMEQLCSKTEDEFWETLCEQTCASIFLTVKLPALQLQVLRCIPQTTRRVHELRRRLALSFFFEEPKYMYCLPNKSLDLSEVTERLKTPRFMISKDTDYPELAAAMSILNIGIDNGLSVRHDVTDLEDEVKFNREVDLLASRIKQIWGSINDAGAAFMSRSYAKEMMEGLRMRLELTIRTKPKPKLSIFETEEPSEDRVVLKQTTLSRKLFHRKPADEGVV